MDVKQLAFGYTQYQSSWPEQTPLAISHLSQLLFEMGITLSLPVHEIPSKAAAAAELRQAGLTSEALEQRCLQQQHNLPLAPEIMEAEIVAWATALRSTLAKIEDIPIHVIAEEIIQ